MFESGRQGKLEVIYKNRWEGILGVVLGLGDGRASRRRRANVRQRTVRDCRHLVAFEDQVRAALEEAADLGGALRAARAVLVRNDVVREDVRLALRGRLQFRAAAPARARARRVRGGEGHFVRFIDQGGGRLVADSPAECQKLVLVELHVSQASAAGTSRCLGRDESS